MKTFKIPVYHFIIFFFPFFRFFEVVNLLTLTSNIFFIQNKKYTLIKNEKIGLIYKLLKYKLLRITEGIKKKKRSKQSCFHTYYGILNIYMYIETSNTCTHSGLFNP